MNMIMNNLMIIQNDQRIVLKFDMILLLIFLVVKKVCNVE